MCSIAYFDGFVLVLLPIFDVNKNRPPRICDHESTMHQIQYTYSTHRMQEENFYVLTSCHFVYLLVNSFFFFFFVIFFLSRCYDVSDTIAWMCFSFMHDKMRYKIFNRFEFLSCNVDSQSESNMRKTHLSASYCINGKFRVENVFWVFWVRKQRSKTYFLLFFCAPNVWCLLFVVYIFALHSLFLWWNDAYACQKGVCIYLYVYVYSTFSVRPCIFRTIKPMFFFLGKVYLFCLLFIWFDVAELILTQFSSDWEPKEKRDICVCHAIRIHLCIKLKFGRGKRTLYAIIGMNAKKKKNASCIRDDVTHKIKWKKKRGQTRKWAEAR